MDMVLKIDEIAGIARTKVAMSPMPPEIVDSHCHLDFPDFNGELPES